jgi:glutathione S-transferase
MMGHMGNSEKVKIYYIPGSHPCEAVFKAAEIKGIEYKRVVVLPPTHRLQMTLMFGGRTVPAAKIGGEKVQGSRAIIRSFESMVPEPALFPGDAAQRERVIAAETWGDGDFQDEGRRLIWSAMKAFPESMASFSVGHKVPVPGFVADKLASPVIWAQAKLNKADEDNVRADLERFPALLDEADEYVANGVIGGDEPNAADLQILGTIWLWRAIGDLRELIDSHRCGQASAKLFGEPGGSVPKGAFPAAWLSEINASRAVTA